MRDYPQLIVAVDQVEPAPRRVRGVLNGAIVFDSTRALYVWERPHYPQYYLPLADVTPGALVDEQRDQPGSRGTARWHGLRAGSVHRPGTATVYGADAIAGLADTVTFRFAALDAWYEEDERIFVHPRSPYCRVDAVRSSRSVRVELDGTVLAESSSPVMVFETGLPTRYYLPRTHADFGRLVPSDTVTECPYKGTTSAYWSVRTAAELRPDLAWSYDFPTAPLLAVAGMVAFYNERVDHIVDGVRLERPESPFSG